METILVTGGAGYIGSHVVREMAAAGYRTVTLDNLQSGHVEAVLSGEFYQTELSDEASLEALFTRYSFTCVMHFAGHSNVGESIENPKVSYEDDLLGALVLLRVMLRHQVRNFIFSSSCTVYAPPRYLPLDESHPVAPLSPYGEAKHFLECILRHYDRAYGLRFVSLRYFNAGGASLDGQLGESHNPEAHLIPCLLEVANGESPEFLINGSDYSTRDGSCVRDFVHVLDLASAHLAAHRWLCDGQNSKIFNLGAEQGYTVLEILNMARLLTGRKIPARVIERRPGDASELVADSKKARRLLEWQPTHSALETILESAWFWQQHRKF